MKFSIVNNYISIVKTSIPKSCHSHLLALGHVPKNIDLYDRKTRFEIGVWHFSCVLKVKEILCGGYFKKKIRV